MIPELFLLVSNRYWAMLLSGLLLALVTFLVFRNPRGKLAAAILAGTVVTLFVAFPCRKAWQEKEAERTNRIRLAQAEARFTELCKMAGEKIHKTVTGVDGVALLKLRPSNYDPSNRDAIDPYGEDYDWTTANAYIGSFLQARNKDGFLVEKVDDITPGFRYVDAPDAKDGKIYRYSAHMNLPEALRGTYDEPLFMLRRQPVAGTPARYAVTYDDITTPEDRAFWIAGSSLKVIDTDTKEVIAERVGYLIDKGLGKSNGLRKPWAHALATPGWSCPMHIGSGHTRSFVEKVLKTEHS